LHDSGITGDNAEALAPTLSLVVVAAHQPIRAATISNSTRAHAIFFPRRKKKKWGVGEAMQQTEEGDGDEEEDSTR
jgi:hypothetical protein